MTCGGGVSREPGNPPSLQAWKEGGRRGGGNGKEEIQCSAVCRHNSTIQVLFRFIFIVPLLLANGRVLLPWFACLPLAHRCRGWEWLLIPGSHYHSRTAPQPLFSISLNSSHSIAIMVNTGSRKVCSIE